MKKYLRYFNTLKYMKLMQIKYRLFYLVRSKIRKFIKFSYELSKPSNSNKLDFIKSIYSYTSYQNNSFTFLNISHQFKDRIDWNYSKYGKLWTYNLNYFEYLNQEDFSKDLGIDLIKDYITNINRSKDGLEPFPISLRGINWIKFLSYNNIKDELIDNSLYAQYYILKDNLEYHVLGNHLLENGFSLLFGAYYFNDDILYKKAKEILFRELEEEILPDGGHFELSPMYHQLMLYRVLDCINLVQNNSYYQDKKLTELLFNKAAIMLSWLKQISYKDGSIPHFNDSANNIAPTTNKLIDYAKRLGVDIKKNIELFESGYRVYNSNKFELRLDVGEIGPSYIPGHAHSDTFNFELRINDSPYIVDTGTSTYENNSRRLLERETESHNTVKVAGINQSEVWSSFRVANRANIIELKEKKDSIEASHNGYKKLGIIHKRLFNITDKSIIINDYLIGKSSKKYTSISYIHFHPDIDEVKIKENKIITKKAILIVKGSKKIQLDDFKFAKGFNIVENAKVLKITFVDKLFVEIIFY